MTTDKLQDIWENAIAIVEPPTTRALWGVLFNGELAQVVVLTGTDDTGVRAQDYR